MHRDDPNARLSQNPRQTGIQTDRQTDRRTNIMTIAPQFILTSTSRAKNVSTFKCHRVVINDFRFDFLLQYRSKLLWVIGQSSCGSTGHGSVHLTHCLL